MGLQDPVKKRLQWVIILAAITVVCTSQQQCWNCSAECSRCIRQAVPVDTIISEFYSGLFSASPPPASENLQGFISGDEHTAALRSSSRAAENPYATPPRTHYGCCETRYRKLGRKKHELDGGRCSQRRLTNEVRYSSPNITTINNRNYTVVHLKGMFQYIPTGRCKSGLTCSHGECVQKYRAHWVLVYNSSTTRTGPPVSFVPIKVHSHCECLNVGRRQ